MKPYTLTIRFRETDEYEAKVGTYMKNLSEHTDKSKNRFVIDLIAEHMKRSEQKQQEDDFVEKIRKIFREEMQGLAFEFPDSEVKTESESFVTEMTEDEKTANVASVLDDLKMFC